MEKVMVDSDIGFESRFVCFNTLASYFTIFKMYDSQETRFLRFRRNVHDVHVSQFLELAGTMSITCNANQKGI